MRAAHSYRLWAVLAYGDGPVGERLVMGKRRVGRELEEARAEALRMTRNASRKIARMEKNNGARVKGTAQDVRKSRALIERYNRKQLEAYKERLVAFNDRRNQLYGDMFGNPLPAKVWSDYKRAERANNRAIDNFYSRFKDLTLPSGEKVSDRMARVTPTYSNMSAQNTIYKGITRTPKMIGSATGLQKLTDDLSIRALDKDFVKATSEARDQYSQLSEMAGNSSLDKGIASLTTDQFQALWHYTDFVQSMATFYDILKKGLSDKEGAVWQEVADQSMKDAMKYVEWAKRLPSNIQGRSSKKKRVRG